MQRNDLVWLKSCENRVNTQHSKPSLLEAIRSHVRDMSCLCHYTCAKFTPSPLCPLEKDRSVLLNYLLNYKVQNTSNLVLRTLLAFLLVTPLLNSELSPNKLPVVSSMCLALPGPWKIVHFSPFIEHSPRFSWVSSYMFFQFHLDFFFVCLTSKSLSPFTLPSWVSPTKLVQNGGPLHIHPYWSLCTVCLTH